MRESIHCSEESKEVTRQVMNEIHSMLAPLASESFDSTIGVLSALMLSQEDLLISIFSYLDDEIGVKRTIESFYRLRHEISELLNTSSKRRVERN